MNVFAMELRRMRKGMLIWLVIVSALVGLFLGLYPSFANSGIMQSVTAQMDALPKELLQALNIDQVTNFADLLQYMCYTLQYVAMATGIYACMLGTRSLASDIGDGSIAFLYAQPIRRSGIVTKKLLACLFNFSIFMLLLGAVSIGVGFLVCPWSTDLVQLASDIGTLVFGMYLTGLTFMALGFFLSSLLNSGRTAVPAALGAFFVTYVLGVVSKLRSEVDFLYYASPVEWFSPSRIYSKGILLEDVCLALGVMAVCILAAYLIYRRKDLQVS